MFFIPSTVWSCGHLIKIYSLIFYSIHSMIYKKNSLQCIISICDSNLVCIVCYYRNNPWHYLVNLITMQEPISIKEGYMTDSHNWSKLIVWYNSISEASWLLFASLANHMILTARTYTSKVWELCRVDHRYYIEKVFLRISLQKRESYRHRW